MSETLFAQANPTGITGYATTTENGSYGVYFTVSHACTLTAIWFYSPSGASSLPTSTALYSTAAGTSGTLLAQNSSPSWSGAAGSGWVRDGSFPATALSTGTTYVGQYYSASFKQGYLYTGSFPGPLYPATSSPSGLAVAATQYFGGDSNAPYLNSANGFPSSTLGAGVNWLCDVEVSLPVTLPTAAQPPYQPPAWHPASGPGMPGGEPFASYAAASYNPLIPAEVPQPGPSRLFPATSGPSTATSNGGDWISGVAFQATEGGQWLEGYWWWVCASGQSTSPVKCALWNAYQPASVSGTLITGSVVTSGTLTAGAWNWIPLATPVPLAIATTYIAAIGVNGNYPDTTAQFGSGDPHAAGITDGPLSAFSAQSGSNPDPYSLIGNGIYSTAGTDPSVTIPGTESATADNLWVDVQVSGTVPAGYAGPFPIWPAKYDSDTHTTPDSSVNYVVGTEFWLAEPCAVNSVRYFSPPGTAQLATEVTIWNVVTQAAVYDNTSPSWSGAAASGWVSCTLTGVTLPPGAYRVTVFNNAGSPDGWSAKRFGYWGGGGLVPGGGPQVTGNGITLGPLFVPSTAQAGNCYSYDTSGAGNTPPFSYPDGRQEPGQCVFAESGSNTYPSLYVDAAFQNYWVDVSVSLVTPGGAAAVAVITAPPCPAGPAPPPVPPQVITAPAVAAVSEADAGAAADALTVSAAVTFADAAGALDQQAPYADEAAAADTLAVTVTGIAPAVITAPPPPPPFPWPSPPIPAQVIYPGGAAIADADAAGAADALSVAASVPLADAGAAGEYEAPDGMRQDQGGAADALSVAATVPLGDAAGAVEWSCADGSRDDSGGAAEQVAVAVTVPLPDAGAALDVFNAGNPYVYETGAATEALATQMTSAVPAVIAGPAQPLPSLPAIAPQVIGGQSPAVAVSLADVAAAAGWQYADGSRPDTAGGADSLTASVAVQFADIAAAAELTPVIIPDTAGAAEALAVVVGPVQPDTAGGAETLAISVTTAGWSDAAGASDAFAALSSTANTGHVEWLVTPAPARWQACPAPPRWKATLMNFGPVAAISLEYLNMLWTADLAGTEIDPTGQTAGQPELDVLFAVPQSSGNPLEPAEPQTWFTAAWLTGANIRGYVAQGLAGPSPAPVQLTAGLSYDVWGKIEGAPETPVKFCGTVAAY